MSQLSMDASFTEASDFALRNLSEDMIQIVDHFDDPEHIQDILPFDDYNNHQHQQHHHHYHQGDQLLPQELTEQINSNQFVPNMPVAQLIRLPAPTPKIVCNEEYEGPFNFDVSIVPNGSKTPWIYSSELKKIFINMGHQFPVDFKITGKSEEYLFIRATPVYSLPQHSQEPVYRCISHEQPKDTSNINVSENITHHIVRCLNQGTFYIGDKSKDERLSVVIPLSEPQTGTDAVREYYIFMCKNSCPTGMNRRPIEVIFTLENEGGFIYGRRVMNVRICSCPKRDKEKEEKEIVEKGDVVPHGKKRKLDKKVMNRSSEPANDTEEYNLDFKIVGKHNYQAMLKFGHDLMAGEVFRHKSSIVQAAAFKRCLDDIASKINKHD